MQSAVNFRISFLTGGCKIKHYFLPFRQVAKKINWLPLFILLTHNSYAQKITVINQSPLTGIILPKNSKLDKRILMLSSARVLLTDEASKTNMSIGNVEVLSLPPLNNNGYSKDTLIAQAKNAGWKITVIAEDNSYFWLEQNNKHILAYVKTSKKETSILFGESNQSTQIRAVNNNIKVQNEEKNPIEKHANISTQQIIEQQVQESTMGTVTFSGFKFNTTNFDDGWISKEHADWVEVTKNNIKVLLHFPKEGTVFPADPQPLISAAWNILVAPRYSNLQNYTTTYISDYNKPYMGMGYATENATGKAAFVVLFKQSGGWIEVVAPDKNSFIQQFKFDPEAIRYDSETSLLKSLDNMSGYNKFAIDAVDFEGKWTNDFTGIQQLYNVYSGNYAGMHMNQSNEEFIFGTNNTYNWKLLVVNSMGGMANANQVKSSGTFTIPNNWQIHFSKIESTSKTYNAFWSSIKGARFLNLLNATNPGSGIYQQYGLAR